MFQEKEPNWSDVLAEIKKSLSLPERISNDLPLEALKKKQIELSAAVVEKCGISLTYERNQPYEDVEASDLGLLPPVDGTFTGKIGGFIVARVMIGSSVLPHILFSELDDYCQHFARYLSLESSDNIQQYFLILLDFENKEKYEEVLHQLASKWRKKKRIVIKTSKSFQTWVKNNYCKQEF